jgi:transposase InsO family protein
VIRIDAELTLEVLRIAIVARAPLPKGLIHHSDRGAQRAATDYTQTLLDRQIRISMSRKGNLDDNARCERFMKTLKQVRGGLLERIRESVGCAPSDRAVSRRDMRRAVIAFCSRLFAAE